MGASVVGLINRYERLGPRGAWTVAVMAPLVVAAVLVPARTHVPPSDLALVMVAVVALAVVPGFLVASLTAGLSAGVWFDFFLTRPYESFTIHAGDDVQTAVLMAVVAAAVGVIASRRRHFNVAARRAGDEVIGLYVTAQMLSAGSRTAAVLDTVADQLAELLFLKSCRFCPDPAGDDEPIINRAGEIDWRAHVWSLPLHGWPSVDVNLPVDSAGSCVGRFVLSGTGGAELTQDRLLTALALADLAGAAVARAPAQQPSES